LPIAFSEARLPEVIDPSVSLCVYRIAQEALHNVAKHSRAREASVRLEREGEEILLVIADSGVGFDPLAVNRAGIGLSSMRERVGVLDGQLVIQAAPGGGTEVRVRVPMSPPVADAQLASEPA
jgi:signal transduction histidine kinase